MSDSMGPTAGAERRPRARWRSWWRPAFAIGVTGVLIALGIANIAMRARWHEVEDGVLWGSRAEGLTAIEVARNSSAAAAGVRQGDLLIAIDGQPVDNPADVIEYQHRAHEGTRLSYTLVRLRTKKTLDLSLTPETRPSSLYFVLAAVGLFTLIVGASVRLRRPFDEATLHFFWLCIAFFGAFTFSFNGPFDRLDWIFYWGDAVAMVLLPPLLLDFTAEFPQRPARSRSGWARFVPLVYIPAMVLGAARVMVVTRGAADGPAFSRAIDVLDRADH